MIEIISGAEGEKHAASLAEVFRLRKRVFHDLLGWDVNVRDDIEIDHYDDANPVYVLSRSPEGRLRGALRLLPTLGPNMLDDTFPQLLGGQPEIRSAAIWESSRFCIEPEISQDRASNQVTIAAAELMCGVGELGIASGVSHVVTVTDVFLERMFRRMGCPGERIGPPQKIGSVMAVGIAWEVNDALLDRMKAVADISDRLVDPALSLGKLRAA
ncbi:acyl-homoserine-lactone synthase [Rhizobium halophytocola]|uniref:Acyl-homoserine-lactone synthase n=1 Tax=Rhizobium halophytocola TaxID=735519 RepID=A0ABS4DZ64_9HYPH|nr:acyl-homoserine-lactone synthase [Rhizobium halophytocola]MBP1850979.1 acyl homoserine lactone synthase [Rhizobium halophytocola]